MSYVGEVSIAWLNGLIDMCGFGVAFVGSITFVQGGKGSGIDD